jgi:hypothetical protein
VNLKKKEHTKAKNQPAARLKTNENGLELKQAPVKYNQEEREKKGDKPKKLRK